MAGISTLARIGAAPFVVQSSARSCTSEPPSLPPAVALPDAPTMLQDALMSCSSSERAGCSGPGCRCTRTRAAAAPLGPWPSMPLT